MAKKILNIDLEVLGKLNLSTVPNTAGDILTFDGLNQVSKRTPVQILSDIGGVAKDGTTQLTANWDVGAFNITAQTFITSGGDSNDWNTAFSWGDHAAAGYITSFTENDTLATVTARGATTAIASSFTSGLTVSAVGNEVMSFTRSGNANLTIGVSGSGDLSLEHSGSGDILIDGAIVSSALIGNWNIAYGWGDHSGLYSLIGHTHTESDITDLQDYLLSVDVSDINATGTASAITYLRGDGVWSTVASGGGGTWGSITGTLSAQTDLQSALDLKLNSSTYTATDILAKLITVDGTNSGLDADLYHGYNLSAGGNRWGVMAEIRTDGVFNVGKYIDFHNTDGTFGLDGRITLTELNKWTFSSGEVTGNAFKANALTSNVVSATDECRVDGYGIMTNRASATYFTNGATGGSVRIGNGGIHNAKNIAVFNDAGVAVTGAITTTSNIVASGVIQSGGNVTIGGSGILQHTGLSSRDKVRVWNSSLYTIGMSSSMTYGGLNDYAMTFQMNNDSDRGFWWGHDNHTNAQGAMSLTTHGVLKVESTITASNFILSSDRNLKKNIETYNPYRLDFRTVKFDWKDSNKGKNQIGYIAQEVEKVSPSLVLTDKNGEKSVKYIDVLVAKMAEKDEQIEDLTTRIERLELIIKDLL